MMHVFIHSAAQHTQPAPPGPRTTAETEIEAKSSWTLDPGYPERRRGRGPGHQRHQGLGHPNFTVSPADNDINYEKMDAETIPEPPTFSLSLYLSLSLSLSLCAGAE